MGACISAAEKAEVYHYPADIPTSQMDCMTIFLKAPQVQKQRVTWISSEPKVQHVSAVFADYLLSRYTYFNHFCMANCITVFAHHGLQLGGKHSLSSLCFQSREMIWIAIVWNFSEPEFSIAPMNIKLLDWNQCVISLVVKGFLLWENNVLNFSWMVSFKI